MTQQPGVFGPYDNGKGEQVYADPQTAYRLLAAHTGGRLNELCEKARSDDAVEYHEAIEVLSEAARAAFSLTPFDPSTGTGATELLTCQTLQRFFAYLHAQKKSTVSYPTSSPPTLEPVSR